MEVNPSGSSGKKRKAVSASFLSLCHAICTLLLSLAELFHDFTISKSCLSDDSCASLASEGLTEHSGGMAVPSEHSKMGQRKGHQDVSSDFLLSSPLLSHYFLSSLPVAMLPLHPYPANSHGQSVPSF